RANPRSRPGTSVGANSCRGDVRAGPGSRDGNTKRGLAVPVERRERTPDMSDTTTDHDTIRKWAEAKGGRPAAAKSTHSGTDVGIIRIMFPDAPNSEHDALVEISWDEFFEEFEKRELALVYEKDSMFSKIIGRDTAEKRARGDHDAAR